MILLFKRQHSIRIQSNMHKITKCTTVFLFLRKLQYAVWILFFENTMSTLLAQVSE